MTMRAPRLRAHSICSSTSAMSLSEREKVATEMYGGIGAA